VKLELPSSQVRCSRPARYFLIAVLGAMASWRL